MTFIKAEVTEAFDLDFDTIVKMVQNTFASDFLRIIDWMPYIVELDFEGQELISITEHAYIEKEFKGKARADKK